jgi:CRP-like cAMP-binding protein
MFLEVPMPFDAVVSRRALVCQLDRKALLTFLSSAPSASLRWMGSIAVRLDDDRRRLLAIMTSDLTRRTRHSTSPLTARTTARCTATAAL